MSKRHHSTTTEYKRLFRPPSGKGARWNRCELQTRLVENAEWTMAAADELLTLAEGYGRWFLRHAADVAEALEIEDGSKQF